MCPRGGGGLEEEHVTTSIATGGLGLVAPGPAPRRARRSTLKRVLHRVNPASDLGQLATEKPSVSSMISDPTRASSLLAQVASHIYLGPGTRCPLSSP